MNGKARQARFSKEFIPKSWICLKNGYTFSLFRKDLIAGLTVGVIALPLAMAFAIASGTSPISGLYTAIIAGFLISLLGGSYSQIGGPTGAFVVVIYNIVQNHGYSGLVLATLLAGVILIVSALFRLGFLLKYVPYPLVVGFTSGIAVIIFSSQIKDFFGLQIQNLPADFIPKWHVILSSFYTWNSLSFAVASGSLILIILIRRFVPVLPWGITAICVATVVSQVLQLPIETIASRFGEIPRHLPTLVMPNFSISFAAWRALIPEALTIAFLAGIEALLSAVVADGMTGRRHKSNCELMAVGIANIGSVLFGGIPATGAIARTATSIKTGSKTPFAGMIHALTLLLIVVAIAPIVSLIPLAALSAVLVMVAWNMSEIRHFHALFKAPPCDIAILLVTFFLTVLVDLTVGVGVGIVLSAFLFIKRMKDVSNIKGLYLETEKGEAVDKELLEKKVIPDGVDVYEITGPFFFGLADSLKDIFANLEFHPKVFILHMRDVPSVDATGMHALREFFYKCQHDKTTLILSGANHFVLQHFRRFGIEALIGKEYIFSNLEQALQKADELVQNQKYSS